MRSLYGSCSVVASIGLMSLLAILPSCGVQEGGADDSAQSDPTAVERAALSRGTRLDHAQAISLLGDKVPAALGESCSTIGATCAPSVTAPTSPTCTSINAGNVCENVGTQPGVKVDFVCLPGSSGLVCSSFSEQQPVSISCSIPTDGISCNTGCDTPQCSSYPSICANQTNEIQRCQTATCAQGTCGTPTVTTSIVGTCTRTTEGERCGPLTGCFAPKAPICTVTGSCACLLGAE